MSPKELEQTIRSLLKQPVSDAELRERLERLAESEISFSGFTWLFGPELYRRNRVLFGAESLRARRAHQPRHL
jgi:hypothetical protein